MLQKAGPLWKPSHVWLLIASFLRKSETPENHLKASIAYSSTQQWILSDGFLGVSIYVKKTCYKDQLSRWAGFLGHTVRKTYFTERVVEVNHVRLPFAAFQVLAGNGEHLPVRIPLNAHNSQLLLLDDNWI